MIRKCQNDRIFFGAFQLPAWVTEPESPKDEGSLDFWLFYIWWFIIAGNGDDDVGRKI